MDLSIFNNNRNSNLELLRILAMMGIVASHYIGCIIPQLHELNTPLSNFLLIQGTWGKIGINCFMLISGYFMCIQDASLKKWIKLLAWVYFYTVVIEIPLIIFGFIPNTFESWWHAIFPWRFFDMDHFKTAFLIFYLFTPFVKKFIQTLTKKELERILILLTIIFVGYYNMPTFSDGMAKLINPLVWFSYLYLLAGYIRLYDNPFMHRNTAFWGGQLLLGVILVCSSTLILHYLGQNDHVYKYSGYTNSIFVFYTSLSSFIFFLKVDIPKSIIINVLGASTFGVLLIHTCCDTVYYFIFDDMLKTPVVLGLDFPKGVLVVCVSILSLYLVLSFIDILRRVFIEPILLKKIYSIFKIA